MIGKRKSRRRGMRDPLGSRGLLREEVLARWTHCDANKSPLLASQIILLIPITKKMTSHTHPKLPGQLLAHVQPPPRVVPALH